MSGKGKGEATCRLGKFSVLTLLKLVLSLAVLLAVGACAGEQTGRERSSGTTFAVAGFPAANFYGWQKISEAEARQAALALNIQSQDLKSWRQLAPALAASKKYVSRRPQGEVAVSGGDLTATWGQINRALGKLEELLPALDRHPLLLAEHFSWYRLGPDVSFTGYYEPTLMASHVRTERFKQPLYRLPPDVKKGRPYHDRYAIDERGVLAGRGLEIAYIESKVDSFFLQVQGSGRLQFTDGSIKHVLYAGKNNQSYVSLGRVMKEKGLLAPDNVNMRSIRKYLNEHPSEAAALLAENPSYVFFRLADAGPLGAMQAVLTPRVSLATDSSVLPLGTLLAFAVPLPGQTGKQGQGGLLTGIGLPQDRGGAIKGNRADLFCGAGPWAEHTAGYLDIGGAVFMLLPKN